MEWQEYKRRLQNQKYKELEVTDCDSGKEYVFISYRSSSWEIVLTDIVYKLQKKYHLRIYFDKDFASGTSTWLEQFEKNADSKNCKAMLCFLDEGYVTGYATVLELMHAMNSRSQLSRNIYAINFPIDWEKLDDRDEDTGLGVKNLNNPTWAEEKKQFDDEAAMLKEEGYKDIEKYYKKDKPFRVCDCKNIAGILQPKNRRAYFDDDDFYEQFIINPLKKACPGVFEDAAPVAGGRGDAKKKQAAPSAPAGDFHYTIFGKQYQAGSREQGKLMYDAFSALMAKHPEKAGLLTRRTSVARADSVTDPETHDAKPSYFRTGQKFTVGGVDYYVGTSYGFEAKLSEIKGMFQICGEDAGEFVLNGTPLK